MITRNCFLQQLFDLWIIVHGMHLLKATEFCRLQGAFGRDRALIILGFQAFFKKFFCGSKEFVSSVLTSCILMSRTKLVFVVVAWDATMFLNRYFRPSHTLIGMLLLGIVMPIASRDSAVHAQGNHELLLSTGDSVPGFGSIFVPTLFGLNDSGAVGISTSLSGVSSSINEAVYTIAPDGQLVQVARKGQSNPSSLGGNYGSMRGFDLDNEGRVLFQSFDLPGFNTANNSGLYLYDGSSTTEVVRKGNLVDGGGEIGDPIGRLDQQGPQ